MAYRALDREEGLIDDFEVDLEPFENTSFNPKLLKQGYRDYIYVINTGNEP